MSLPARWQQKIEASDSADEIMELQMGPSHPASHGTIKFNLKLDGERVADCDVEVGYRLLHNAWGQGFATEGATELIRYGFDDLGLNKIIGVTHPGNRASQRVLMKVGLDDAGYERKYYARRLRLFVGQRDPSA